MSTSDPSSSPISSVSGTLRVIDPYELFRLTPSITSLSSLLANSEVSPQDATKACEEAVILGASNGDSDLLEWVLRLRERHHPVTSNDMFKSPSPDIKDHGGSPAIILASCFGHGDAVRVLVESGADVQATDAAGWTPLHWACRGVNFPMAWYLLNRGADARTKSLKGTPPLALVKRGTEGDVLRETIRSALEAPSASTSKINNHRLDQTTSLKTGQSVLDDQQYHRLDAIAKLSAQFQLDPGLFHENDHLSIFDNIDSSIHSHTNHTLEYPHYYSQSHPKFCWDKCLHDQMLVFTVDDIPSIIRSLLTSHSVSFAPFPRSQRLLPANTLFLLSRFAAYHCTSELLNELLFTALDRIENLIQADAHNLASNLFWLSNLFQLLYYLRKDILLSQMTRDHQLALTDLSNEIFVFIVRTGERKIDEILESCLLDHEAVPGFENVQFEDEWRFIKAITNRTKKESTKPSSVLSFFSPNPSPSVSPEANNANTSNSTKRHSATSSPHGLSRKGTSLMNLRSRNGGHHRRSSSGIAGIADVVKDGIGVMSGGNSTDDAVAKLSGTPTKNNYSRPIPQLPSLESPSTPKQVTDILSSLLFAFESYEIHPAIVVQSFSQIFYWLSCEIFNRILTKRKYLCRSRAVQIRLNISSLEDWARLNRLPSRLVTTHSKPLELLLQWLQCLSSEKQLDELVGTLQNFSALNPLQLQKAGQDYRYEVDEEKMSDECYDYLSMMRFDFEKRLDDSSVDEKSSKDAFNSNTDSTRQQHTDPQTSISKAKEEEDVRLSAEEYIDKIFLESIRLSTYDPVQFLKPNHSLLLTSNYMLPFAIPSSIDTMVAHLHRNRDVFGPFSTNQGSLGEASRDQISTSEFALSYTETGETVMPSKSETSMDIGTSLDLKNNTEKNIETCDTSPSSSPSSSMIPVPSSSSVTSQTESLPNNSDPNVRDVRFLSKSTTLNTPPIIDERLSQQIVPTIPSTFLAYLDKNIENSRKSLHSNNASCLSFTPPQSSSPMLSDLSASQSTKSFQEMQSNKSLNSHSVGLGSYVLGGKTLDEWSDWRSFIATELAEYAG